MNAEITRKDRRKERRMKCGRTYYIGRYEEQNAWECVVYTAQHLYIAQCRNCGGLIEVRAREDDRK